MKRKEDKIILELSRLIEISCSDKIRIKEFSQFHRALIKIAYNARDVSFDYHRRRIHMSVVMDCDKEEAIVPKMAVNLYFKNLTYFLKSCIFLDKNTVIDYIYLLMDIETNGSLNLPQFSKVS